MLGRPTGTTAAESTDAAPVPAEFVAVTLNLYETPLVRPATVHEVEAVEQVNEPGVEVTVYAETADPPLDAGAVHETTDEPVAFTEVTCVADTPDGATGGPTGTTEFDEVDATDVPAEFVAVTENEYETPLVRPATVHEVEEVVHVFEPGFEVTMYEVIDAPPFEAGGVHDTTDEPDAFAEVTTVAETPATEEGTVAGTAAEDAADAPEVPAEFVAVTVNE